MIRNRDIIVVGLQPWDIKIGSNCKNMAQELSQYNRVLYVNRALDRISAIRSSDDEMVLTRKASLRGDTNDLKPVSASLWTLDPRTVLESINWIPVPSIFDRINLVNNKRLAREINQAAKRLGFNDALLFIDNDFFRAQYLPELLEGVKETIYYIRDNLTSQPYFKKHGVRLEPLLMQKATMVAANSAYLAAYGAKYNKASFDIGQGCDFGWTKEEYPPFKDFKSPVIGYVGALIKSRLNISLLEQIATQRPEWTLILVGPEDEAFRNSSLHQLKNVHFMGARHGGELPSWLSTFDVCINPQELNEMTIGNYPRKIDEYLALGKPVVATDTVAMQIFAPYVYLCKTADDYIINIDTALQEGDNTELQEARKAFAFSHTWEQCIALMGAYLEQTQNVEA
ncbi:glycosyltransferase [[Flexibacter] sp. ATCC 35208]|uniref:glycosyltransferase n=1 Tax=[Flexibacter] sp. ATCC 35208 TaxID=1936242 RepID=UPI0009FB1C09|nr:glycosyltransferase [[Flexibacter] sp. ATCC 35208]